MSALFRPPAMNVRSVRVTADKERTGRPPIYAVASNAPHPLYLGGVDVGRIGKQFTLRQTELRPFPYLRVGFTLRRLQPRSPSGASAISGLLIRAAAAALGMFTAKLVCVGSAASASSKPSTARTLPGPNSTGRSRSHSRVK